MVHLRILDAGLRDIWLLLTLFRRRDVGLRGGILLRLLRQRDFALLGDVVDGLTHVLWQL